MNIKDLNTIAKAKAVSKEDTTMNTNINLTKAPKKTLITEPTAPECILYLMKDEKVLGKRTFDTKQEQIEWYKTSVTKLNSCDSYVSRVGNLVTILDAVVKPERKPTKIVVSQESFF